MCYNWIGRPVRTHKKSICRETEMAAYNGFEYTNEELSTRPIQWWCAKNIYFHFLVDESSNTEVSGASEVPQSHGKLDFRK